jgi:hypothetical protein
VAKIGLLLILLLGSNAFAYQRIKTVAPAPTPAIKDASLDFKLGTLRPVNGPDDARSIMLAFEGTKYWGDWATSVEMAYSKISEQGNETLNLATQSLEATLWGQYRLWHNESFGLVAGAGVGGRQDTIDTSLFGNTSTERSEVYGYGAARALATYTIKNSGTRILFETRINIIPNYDTQELAFAVGIGQWLDFF